MLNNARERLTLSAKTDKAVPPPKAPAAAPVARTKPYDHARHVREWQLEDGRPFAVHRHAVFFVCPLKNDASLSLVSVRGGKNPVPIRAAYQTFLSWWVAGQKD
jgi:hypothetical protein